MTLPLRCALLSISLSIGAGCSHNVTTDLPTGPTPAAVRITKLTVMPAGGGSLLPGTTVPIATSGSTAGRAIGALAQFSDGTSKFVDAEWTTSDANVAVVRDGALVGVGRGTATITAIAQGMSATETFVVEPGIPGQWVGTYVVDDCRAGTAAVDEIFCAAPAPGRTGGFLRKGSTPPIALSITENGKDLTAQAQFGELRGVLTGPDAGANFFSLTGNLAVNQTSIRIVLFNARVQQDSMEGVFAYEVSVTGLPSWAAVTAHFSGLTRR